MVEKLRLSCWLKFVALLVACGSSQAGFSHELIKDVLQQLNSTSCGQFDAWTAQLCERLSAQQQQRLAWHVPLLEAARSGSELRQLQLRLRPSNSFKQYLWLSYYWQLRRTQRLHSDNMLLPQFAWTLRQLRTEQQECSNCKQLLQNMLQSLPRHLMDLVSSRWLCLKHRQEQLYALPNRTQALGVSSNCSMWQVELLATAPGWLRLANVCELQSVWLVNMLLATHANSYMLLNSVSSNLTSLYCVHKGVAYSVAVDLASMQQDEAWSKDCQWQLNDCTHLPQFLSRYFKN